MDKRRQIIHQGGVPSDISQGALPPSMQIFSAVQQDAS